MIDYHHHSEHSVDSVAPMSGVCRRAVEQGVREIAFTEHVDFIPEEPNTGYFQYEPYMRSIEACRDEFGSDLAVLAAAEVDYCPDFEDEIADWLHDKEFDFVVGSVHYLRGEGNISEPRAAEFFSGKPVKAAYARYFQIVRRSAESGLWDSLGHLDLVKRYGTGLYGPFSYPAFRDETDAILEAVIRNDMALEINASGLRQGPAEAYPGQQVLQRYRELGGEKITVGSDSHTARDLATGVEESLALAKESGFTEVHTFRNRVAKPVMIDDLIGAGSAIATARV